MIKENDALILHAEKFLKFIYVLLAIAIILFIFEIATSEQTVVREAKCFDEKINEIIGAACMEKVNCGAITKLLVPNYCFDKDYNGADK